MMNANSQPEKAKRRASLISVAVVLALIVLKVAVGLLTGSLGILAQAADSVLDLVAAVVALLAVRAASQPPDARHPYGHGKVENLAGLIEALLLLITSAWIIFEAIQRLLAPPVAIQSGLWGVAVMVLSIVASVLLSSYLMGVARRYRSQSLEGNALNFRADVLSSSVVLLGLGLAWIGIRLGPEWSWLMKADALAGLVVALFVLRVSLGLGWRATNELLDAAPAGLADQIKAETVTMPGVQDISTVRVRQAGSATFVDLTIKVDRSASLEEAHQVATTVEQRIGALIDEGDVMVHVDPVRQASESLSQAIRAIAAQQGLRVHNVHAHEGYGQTFVDLHVEVPPDLTLADAHDLTARLEETVRRELPYVDDIHTHIEPMAVPAAGATLEPDEDAKLQAEISAILEEIPGLGGCHNLYLRHGPDGYDVVVHCLARPDLPIQEAHRLSDQAEKRLHAEVPGIAQVLIHMEPEEDEAG
jgi:cation diffusion facilitator family transporter